MIKPCEFCVLYCVFIDFYLLLLWIDQFRNIIKNRPVFRFVKAENMRNLTFKMCCGCLNQNRQSMFLKANRRLSSTTFNGKHLNDVCHNCIMLYRRRTLQGVTKKLHRGTSQKMCNNNKCLFPFPYKIWVWFESEQQLTIDTLLLIFCPSF